MTCTDSVGVFDSGVGGLSVLSFLTELMPGENYIYLGDTANAPYGDKTHDEVVNIALKNTETLLASGCKAIVVACNTATAAAVETLRARFPEVPVIGIEPALKPAFESGCRRVMVLATPRTVSEERFTSLLSRLSEKYGGYAYGVGCRNLAEMVEKGTADESYFEPMFAPGIPRPDGIVLGCTHYSFIAGIVGRASGGIPVFDGALGTARQVKRLLGERGTLNPAASGGTIRFLGGEGCEKFWRTAVRPAAAGDSLND